MEDPEYIHTIVFDVELADGAEVVVGAVTRLSASSSSVLQLLMAV